MDKKEELSTATSSTLSELKKDLGNTDKELKVEEVLDETRTKLLSQVGIYSNNDDKLLLQIKEAKECLFMGIEEYWNKREKTNMISYREEFINYLFSPMCLERSSSYQAGDIAKQNEFKKEDPNKATISLTDLFGKKGVTSYRKALEEEYNSLEFRSAVFKKSTSPCTEGYTWKNGSIPVIYVAGPSGCGKTVVSKKLLEQVGPAMQKKTKKDELNGCTTFVDGGIARDCSQIRRLIILYALSLGYSGITDLHEQSTVLENAKNFVQQAAWKNNHALVIPETFSYWPNIFDIGEQSRPGYIRSMEEFINSKTHKLMFCEIRSNSKLFPWVVKRMGRDRAWSKFPTEVFSADNLNLNKIYVSECKQYGELGFIPGCKGSASAGDKYKELTRKFQRPTYYTGIEHDLIILTNKNKKDGDDFDWQIAGDKDPTDLIVSERVFKEWQEKIAKTNGKIEEDPGCLANYSKNHSEINMINQHENFSNLLIHSQELVKQRKGLEDNTKLSVAEENQSNTLSDDKGENNIAAFKKLKKELGEKHESTITTEKDNNTPGFSRD